MPYQAIISALNEKKYMNFWTFEKFKQLTVNYFQSQILYNELSKGWLNYYDVTPSEN